MRLTADAKQKISLGRGLVRSDVAAVLFDEPLTVIDPELKWQLRSKLKALHRELDLTMIYVTHDQTEALTFADTVVVMHDGRVVQSGTPAELFDRPAHTFVGYFIGSPGMNIVPAEVRGREARIGGHTDCAEPQLRPPAGRARRSRSACGRNSSMSRRRRRACSRPTSSGSTISAASASPRAAHRRRQICREGAAGIFGARRRRRAGVRSVARPRLCRQPAGRGDCVMDKTVNQKAWFLVLPVFLVVAFSAILPLMTVVNYSMQDTFGNNQFFWNGVGWFKELLDPSTDLGARFFASLWRNLFFSAVILAIEVPLGIVVALSMPRAGLEGRGLPRDPGAAAADPVERGRHDLADLRPARHRPARLCAEPSRHQLQLRVQRVRRLGHRDRDGRLALDQPGRAVVLRRPEVDPRRLLSGRPDRRRVALGGVHRDPAAEDEPACC